MRTKQELLKEYERIEANLTFYTSKMEAKLAELSRKINKSRK